jgi:uncharacterized protein with HEPN domain
MPKDDFILMRHMLEAAQKAMSFAAGRSRSDLDEDDMLTFALMKAIEIIGEAASKVSPITRERFGDIPWYQIIGMRNRLIHAYDEVSLDVLWQTVMSNLPPFVELLERIVVSEVDGKG